MRRLDALKKPFGILTALLLVLPGAAIANDQIAKVQNLGDTLVFTPIVEFRELVLTVTGPCGFEYQQVVDRGDLFFRLDETTIDGAYTFNLFRNEAIDPAIVEILREARANFDEKTPKALCREGKLPGAPLVQASGFRVLEGRIILDPRAIEKDLGLGDFDVPAGTNATPASAKDLGIPLKDFVIIDDLIVDGSACIGFDCVNGESFGFDTLRLKENNLRIKFDDTSTASSYPRNDWQLTANDSANGGASKFSIDDISGNRTPFTVEANARSHSLYVDDGGRIGSRTSTPSVEIHTIDGDTPTLRLQQDGSSGFAPQTWDVAGNETNFFIRDVTNGSQLPFRIRPDAPTNSIFIDVDGSVGFGTSSPSDADGLAERLIDVKASSGGDARLVADAGAGGFAEFMFQEDNVNHWSFGHAGNANDRFYIFNYVANREDLTIDATTGQVSILNGLSVTGGCSGCDAVFSPEWDLESIEEHADYMWQNSHLPGVGPTPEGKVTIDVFEKTTGILQELEKAHIYIEQLHERLEILEARLLEQRASE